MLRRNSLFVLLSLALVSIWMMGCGSGSGGTIRISGTLPSSGTVNSSYGPSTLNAKGGSGSYTWSTSGLPPGITVQGSLTSSSIKISGKPTTAGPFAASATVTDSKGNAATYSVTITIAPSSSGPTVFTASLPGGAVGVAYSATLAATGGSTPYTWAQTSGAALPGGLMLTPSTGAITGTPTASGTFGPYVFTVTDAKNAMASSPALMIVIATAPTPTITTISPNSAVAGGAAFTLTINGTNFVASSTVNFGGAAPTTTFVNSTQLTVAIPASSIASTGMLAVTVTNPAPGGGTSNPINFTITSGGPSTVPTINSLSPSCAPAGEQFVDSVNNQLVVGGNNFVASSIVRWNGTDRPTTLDSNSQGKILTAQISASDIAAAGTATVTVFNPPPGGGSSNSLTFTTTPGGVDPQSIAVDSAGKFAYVANAGCSGGVVGYVSMYTINSTTGALASIGPPASSLDYSAESVTVDPFGKFAYVANAGDDFSTDGSVVSYTINATTGALTSTGAIMGNCPGLCVPVSVAVDPSGKFAYVPNGDGQPNSVATYTIDATTGVLTPAGTIAVGGYAVSVAVDPSGKFAYLAAASGTPGSAGNASMYTINSTTGALTSIGTIGAGTIASEPAPTLMTVDPSGKFAYVANSVSNDVSMYTINTTTGALASIGTIAAGTNPNSLAVDPAGKFAYVTNFKSNDVSMYTINGTTGALTPTGSIAAGTSPTAIAVHPSGKFAYVTNSGSNDVSIYSIDGATGALTLIGTTGT